jgi:hypothetical protein
MTWQVQQRLLRADSLPAPDGEQAEPAGHHDRDAASGRERKVTAAADAATSLGRS